MDRWSGLTDLFASCEYWSQAQIALAQVGNLKGAAPLYAPPYLDGARVLIPRGPGNPREGDEYRDYSILDEENYFSLRMSGRSRANEYNDLAKAWFSDFSDIAKYYVASQIAFATRRRFAPRVLENINSRWFDRGAAPHWDKVAQPDPRGFDQAVKFFRTDRPERYYFTVSNDSITSHLLEMSWRELNFTYSQGLTGVDHIPMPKFSDD